MEAIEIDSPQSSFSRRRIEEIRRQHAGEWDQAMERVARDPGQLPRYRVRALELLCQFGPQPSDQLLIDLAADRQAEVRARAVCLLGLRAGEPVRRALEGALADRDSFVRRHACEGLMQQPAALIPVEPAASAAGRSGSVDPLRRQGGDRTCRPEAAIAIASWAWKTRVPASRECSPWSGPPGSMRPVRTALLEKETHLLNGDS